MPVLHGQPRALPRVPAGRRARRGVSYAVLALFLGLLGALVAPATASADPGDPNPNMIDWTVVDTFQGALGNDIPLREGQDDYPQGNPPVDGFGRRHILAHGVVPDHDDIQETVGTAGFCVPAPDNRVISTNTEFSLVVVVRHAQRSALGRRQGLRDHHRLLLPALPPGRRLSRTGTAPQGRHRPDLHRGRSGGERFRGQSLGEPPQRFRNAGHRPFRAVHPRDGGHAADLHRHHHSIGYRECTVDPVDQPQGTSNAVPVATAFAGDDHDYNPSSTSADVGLTSPTKLDYTGVTHLANGTAADLSARLTDFGGDPVPGRSVRFALGTGDDEQSCTATTGDTGSAACTIAWWTSR